MNFIYEKIEEEEYQKIKTILSSDIGNQKEEEVQYCNEALRFSNKQGHLSVRYYQTKKLMLHGNLEGIEDIIKKIKKDLGITTKDFNEKVSSSFLEKEIVKDLYLGFSKSGRGETFGSLFLSGVIIKKEDLECLRGMIGNSKITNMNKIQLDGLFNSIKDKFSYEIKQISPRTIDTLQMNTILDKGYTELIIKLNKESDKKALFINKSEIGYELKNKLEELKNNGSHIITPSKSDENYLPLTLASLISRRARLKEMEILSKDNIIIDPENGEKISFKNGSASNPETQTYLIAYRKLYPFSDFPSFVRTKWGNVREIERRIPKQQNMISFKCKYCQEESYKICMCYDMSASSTECFCPKCCKKIDIMELKGFFNNKEIIIDTSVIISRIISKDFETSKHLEGCKFIVPSILYEELDTKQPQIKEGGRREMESLRKLHESGKLCLEQFEAEDYTDVKNDKKFLRILRSKNGVMLTKDRNLSNFSEINEFVIHIIDNKESYIRKLPK
jgi:ribonuclease HIII/predicted nucleic acid-binding protein